MGLVACDDMDSNNVTGMIKDPDSIVWNQVGGSFHVQGDRAPHYSKDRLRNTGHYGYKMAAVNC